MFPMERLRTILALVEGVLAVHFVHDAETMAMNSCKAFSAEAAICHVWLEIVIPSIVRRFHKGLWHYR
jgi:hypothetical protein